MYITQSTPSTGPDQPGISGDTNCWADDCEEVGVVVVVGGGGGTGCGGGGGDLSV